jgi:Uma2 family endonuclease
MKKGMLHRPETAVDVFKLLPEGVHCQVINNVIYMSPAPSFQHQDIIAEIAMHIRMYAKKHKSGTCVASPIDVFLDKNNAYQPDIIYISNSRMAIIGKDGKLHGAPDMVIEVLSPSNADDDKIKKRIVYEACGVKEYFIVDPSNKGVVSYYMGNKKFETGPDQNGKIVSRMLKKTFKF